VPNFPRLRALALFGRRPPQRVDSLLMPASENLHRKRHSDALIFEDCRHRRSRLATGGSFKLKIVLPK
jgi:hypothetical protein